MNHIRYNKIDEVRRLLDNNQKEKAMRLADELTEEERLILVQIRLGEVVKFLTDRAIDLGID